MIHDTYPNPGSGGTSIDTTEILVAVAAAVVLGIAKRLL